MLFLLKRTVAGALVGLLLLGGVGLVLRTWRGAEATPVYVDLSSLLLGVGVCAAVLCSDGLLHGTLTLVGGEAYLRRYRELAALFRGQTVAALLLGALMAGLGEELVFRGLGTGPAYLIVAAVLFGLLHHLGGALTPLTLWFIWEGLLFAGAILLTGNLLVTMVAHFLHDATGFLLFRRENCANSTS
jgi:membrane protease YdiL (CAAX protease family)